MSVELGKVIPKFSIPATGEQNISAHQFRGKWLIIYFYPKDNTPGCTTEGKDFRDHYAEFEKLNAVVVGVSRDSVKMHTNFKAKHEFPFELLADQEEKLCQLFDVIKEKNMYGKKLMGVERSTFLIDPKGKLAAEWRKVKVKGHIEEILSTLKELS
ncbi:MAG: peroxiredoxin [Gammaproteobacteria bacterium]|nr:peroxiredoxin [Gammaproteobacteria bacterium]